MLHLWSALSTDTCPHEFSWHLNADVLSSRAACSFHLNQRRLLCSASRSAERGKAVPGSALTLLAPVSHGLSLKVLQAHGSVKENQDPTRHCSFRRNRIEFSVGLQV